jgi:hypothetical protein
VERGHSARDMVCTTAPVSYSPQDPGEIDRVWVSKSISIRKTDKLFGHPSPCDNTFLVNQSIFATLDFFLVEKKIVLVRGKESRGKGSKRDEKGQKKISIFFHHTCGSAVT